LASQAFIFFLAGFETSSTTLSFCLYELAVNPDIQTKLREEIDVSLSKMGGQITYDGVQSMKYLGQVIDGKKYSLNYSTNIVDLQNNERLCSIK
jgi:cytochrome P450 family 6